VRLIFLGTGTSFGVPQIGCGCGTCTSSDPRDRRTRTAAIIETDGHRLLIDTPPELRLQLVGAGIDRVDAVLYTHAHADHVHGIDDLRAISVKRPSGLPAYGSPGAMQELAARFSYIFDPSIRPLPGTSKPELTAHPIEAGREFSAGGIAVIPIELPHGDKPVFGYRAGPVAYLTDAKEIPPDARAKLQGIRVLVLNALLPRPHPLHLSIPEAVQAALEIGAPLTFLTHLTHESRHADLLASLPPGVLPAHDGLVVEVPAS
jgi:phosphoribosyl 1,2-cyclic phosphate phosphodiesterase